MGVPGWLVSMFIGLLGAAALGAVGAPAIVALLGGVAVGAFAHRFRRDPPWTATGRRRWRTSFLGARHALDSARHFYRSIVRGVRGPFAAARSPEPPASGWPGGPSGTWHAGDRSDDPPRHEAGGVVTVRCEVVTARLQVWHSTDTGRAYEVPLERGLVDAVPGDLATLSFVGGRPQVRRRPLN